MRSCEPLSSCTKGFEFDIQYNVTTPYIGYNNIISVINFKHQPLLFVIVFFFFCVVIYRSSYSNKYDRTVTHLLCKRSWKVCFMSQFIMGFFFLDPCLSQCIQFSIHTNTVMTKSTINNISICIIIQLSSYIIYCKYIYNFSLPF